MASSPSVPAFLSPFFLPTFPFTFVPFLCLLGLAYDRLRVEYLSIYSGVLRGLGGSLLSLAKGLGKGQDSLRSFNKWFLQPMPQDKLTNKQLHSHCLGSTDSLHGQAMGPRSQTGTADLHFFWELGRLPYSLM